MCSLKPQDNTRSCYAYDLQADLKLDAFPGAFDLTVIKKGLSKHSNCEREGAGISDVWFKIARRLCKESFQKYYMSANGNAQQKRSLMLATPGRGSAEVTL